MHKQSAHELEYSVILNILSSPLSSGFLYSALGFCDYKTSKFKENSGPDYDDMCAYKIG